MEAVVSYIETIASGRLPSPCCSATCRLQERPRTSGAGIVPRRADLQRRPWRQGTQHRQAHAQTSWCGTRSFTPSGHKTQIGAEYANPKTSITVVMNGVTLATDRLSGRSHHEANRRMTQPVGAEARIQPRLRISWRVQVLVNGRTIPGRTTDVSEGGVGLTLVDTVAAGQ